MAIEKSPRGRQGRVTVRTVAARAGVSITTVSRVLNQKTESISPETQRRVVEAARRLDYRPNSLAISLRRGLTRTVGLVIPDISDSYFHLVARGVEDTAQAEGYTVIFCNTDRAPEKERRYVDVLREKQVDAIIFAGGGIRGDEHLRDYHWETTRVVTIGPHRLPFPSVGVDNRAATRAATCHLMGQGCQRIGVVGGQDEWLVNQVRLAGVRDALEEHGGELPTELYWPSGFTVEAGEVAIRRALEAGNRFDGVVAFNDFAAVGAMRALKVAGRRIPDDVAVIGCDDIPLTSLVEPPLSSVGFPLYEFGVAAMRLVLQLAAGRPAPEDVVFPFEVRVRASSLRRRSTSELEG